jgi:hypothetical protein
MRKKTTLILALIVSIATLSNAQNDTIFNKDFNDQDISSGGWTSELVSGPDNCAWDIFISENSAARISNYLAGENQACESWLISPSVDLTNTNPIFNFKSSYNYNGDPLSVLISTDFVSGDPSSAQWTDITSLVNLPSTDNFVWANSGDIDLSSYTMANVHIAFKYIGTNNDGRVWNLDDVILFSGEAIDPQGWDCVNNSCQESVIGIGEYMTQEECQTACTSTLEPTTSVYEIQFSEDPSGISPLEGQMVQTGGIVSAVKDDTTAFFIQNGIGAWSGIYVYDNVNFPQVGDSVTFTAEVVEFYSLTELKNISDFVIVNSNNTVAFTEVTPEMANSEPYEGVLVRLSNVQCNSALNQFDEWTVSDGTNSAIISDFLYTYTPILNQYYNVTGVVDYSFDEFKVCPRNSADVTSVSNLLSYELDNLEIFPNPSNGKIQLKESGKLDVYTLSGQLVFSALLSNKVVDLHEFSSGTYFCKLYDENGVLKGVDKLIIY